MKELTLDLIDRHISACDQVTVLSLPPAPDLISALALAFQVVASVTYRTCQHFLLGGLEHHRGALVRTGRVGSAAEGMMQCQGHLHVSLCNNHNRQTYLCPFSDIRIAEVKALAIIGSS